MKTLFDEALKEAGEQLEQEFSGYNYHDWLRLKEYEFHLIIEERRRELGLKVCTALDDYVYTAIIGHNYPLYLRNDV